MTLRERLRHLTGHTITQNAVALYATQFVLAVVPLVTLPWLAQALGPAGLGRVLFVQSFAFMIVTLVEYGFVLSGAREIARQRRDRSAMAETVAGVLGAKLALMGVAAVAALVAAALVPQFRSDPELVGFGFAMGVLQGLVPLWFFTGLERLRTTAAVDVVVRLLTAAAIIVLVREEGQETRVLWIWTIGAGLSTAILTLLMYRAVPPRMPSISSGRAALGAGGALFLATAAVSLYTSATVFLLGLVVTSAQLALFASAERIVRAAVRVTGPIATATYPRVAFLVKEGSVDRAQRLSAMSTTATVLVAMLTAAVIYVVAPVFVEELFGAGFEGTVGILRTLALLLPAVALSTTLAGLWLLPRGLDPIAVRVAVAAGVANVVLTLVVGSLSGVEAVAWVLVALEAAVALAYAAGIWRRGLFPTRAQLRGGEL